MRIGLTARAATVDGIIEQASTAERDGFTSLWFGHLMFGDPLAAITVAGRATQTIELGTAVLQTYPCHPLLQANRASSVAAAMGRPGLTLGVGPSHQHVVESVYGLSYDHPGRNTEEYVAILARLLGGEGVDFEGEDWIVHSANRMVAPPHPIPVLLAALAPRLLRVAGGYADGAILWLASPAAVANHVAPRIQAAASEAGKKGSRIVAGLPVAVHGDVAEARAAAARSAGGMGEVPNYRRILDVGNLPSAADAAIVGDAASVRSQLAALEEAGATDIWAGIFPVGDDPATSVRGTYEALAEMVA
jgi:F420-dependent oxidoreductase-like protein